MRKVSGPKTVQCIVSLVLVLFFFVLRQPRSTNLDCLSHECPPVIASCLDVIRWSASTFVFVLRLSCSNEFAHADVLGVAKHGDCFRVPDRTERLRAQQTSQQQHQTQLTL